MASSAVPKAHRQQLQEMKDRFLPQAAETHRLLSIVFSGNEALNEIPPDRRWRVCVDDGDVKDLEKAGIRSNPFGNSRTHLLMLNHELLRLSRSQRIRGTVARGRRCRNPARAANPEAGVDVLHQGVQLVSLLRCTALVMAVHGLLSEFKISPFVCRARLCFHRRVHKVVLSQTRRTTS